MRVEQIDLRYLDEHDDRLAAASLHIRSHAPAGQAIFTQLALDLDELRTLEAVLRRALRRVTHRALTLV